MVLPCWGASNGATVWGQAARECVLPLHCALYVHCVPLASITLTVACALGSTVQVSPVIYIYTNRSALATFWTYHEIHLKHQIQPPKRCSRMGSGTFAKRKLMRDYNCYKN